MLKRIITGACYATAITAMFLLREFVDYRIFPLLLVVFASVGTFELARALKGWLVKGNYYCLIIYGIVLVPLYCVLQYLAGGFGFLTAILSCVCALVFVIYSAVCKKGVKLVLANALGYLYPAVFILSMLLANDLGQNKGFIALLLPFVVSALSDTFAFFTGSLIGGKKLCPKLSPKKTWSGAIGGTVGGAVGSLIIYFVFNNKIAVNFFSPIVLFIAFGVIASVLTIIGDLFESFIKRKVGIKDMGNILPGHGGVLDRIDGTSFVALFSYLVFLIV